ncbi:DoxX family protein [Litorihabitans aurantiacus]|uniref:Quinol oxidase n=1 Tax=Litorihabitans aurantiacus TaxID=1930061 RepID=A0AA37XEJ2_9MICO|nr:DoxX family protein [Litorihabitans aurantiacus]GMA31515.1 quinol oxidase [Litorihabitans aurantiacus]
MTTTSTTAPPATPSATTLSIGLLLARVVLGAVMIAHGAQKVFSFTLSGTAASFEEMGVPLASVAGPGLALLELVGGVAIVLGAATRVIGVLFALAMVGAIAIVHLEAGFFASDGGYELVLLLAGVAGALALTGAGRWSVDGLVAARRRA